MPKITKTTKTEKATMQKKKRKKKKKKDPTKPKGKTSAFIYFSNEMRPIVKSKHPDLSFSDMAKELGSRWKLIKDTPNAETYKKKAKADAARHKREMAAWKSASAEDEIGSRGASPKHSTLASEDSACCCCDA